MISSMNASHNDIQVTAEQQHVIPLQIEMNILQAKLFQIEGNFDESERFLEQAIQRAKISNLPDMINKIQREQKLLEESYEVWQKLIQNNAPFQERLKQTQVEDHLKWALKMVRES